MRSLQRAAGTPGPFWRHCLLHASSSLSPRTLQPWDPNQSGSRDVTPVCPEGNRIRISFSYFCFILSFELECLVNYNLVGVFIFPFLSTANCFTSIGVYMISWGFFFIGSCRMWSTFLCVTQWVLVSCFINTSCSFTQLCPTLCDPMDCSMQASLSFTTFWTLLKLMSIESVMPSSHPILCRPLLNLPSIFPSIRVFSNDLAVCIRWPKY